MKTPIPIAAVLLLAACTVTTPPPATPPAPEPPLPPCPLEQHSWEDYHLQHEALSPVVHNQSGYDPAAVTAAWNALNTRIQLRPSGEGFPLTITEGGDENSGWLGLATIRIGAESHITEATVKMNRVLLARFPAVVDEHVLCQEVGHLFGLGHQPNTERDSCMNDCAGLRGEEWLACLSDPQGVTPNAHDAEELNRIYAHVPQDPDAPPCHPPPACLGEIRVHAFPLEGAPPHDHPPHP